MAIRYSTGRQDRARANNLELGRRRRPVYALPPQETTCPLCGATAWTDSLLSPELLSTAGCWTCQRTAGDRLQQAS